MGIFKFNSTLFAFKGQLLSDLGNNYLATLIIRGTTFEIRLTYKPNISKAPETLTTKTLVIRTSNITIC
jgi:hypothetical protein